MASNADTQSVRPIITLPNDVVQKIAAGEVVVRPLNAVKELVENSIDAGATTITVTCKNGGLDLIKVKDNGFGINMADYERVCERFATSKLKTAADLQKISTFGFRGEALASISCMADVQIISKTKDSDRAWTANYKNCVPLGKPKAITALLGTQIAAANLFEDYPQRRSMFTRTNEEAAGIANILIKYAINFPRIKFALVRDGGTRRAGGSFSSLGNGDQHAVIRLLMPPNLVKNLFDFEVNSEKYKFSAKICMASPLSSRTAPTIKAENDKQKIFQLFINNRLVTSSRLKQTVDTAFSTHDFYCPFINIAMQIEPSRIDVNVHPTKELVCFLDETQIIDCIKTELFEILDNFRRQCVVDVKSIGHVSANKRANNTPQKPVVLYQHPSTSFEISPIKGNRSSFDFGQKRKLDTSVDSVNSNSNVKPKVAKRAVDENASDGGAKYKFDVSHAFAKIYAQPSSTVRVDSTNHSITESLTPNTTLNDNLIDTSMQSDVELNELLNTTVGDPPNDHGKYVFKALDEVKSGSSIYLTNVVRKFVFVGFVDAMHAIFQSGDNSFMVDLMPLLEEVFYQKCLRSVGRQNGRRITLNSAEMPNGMPLLSLVDTYLSVCPNARLPNEDQFDSKEDAAKDLIAKFCQPEVAEILWDFGVSIVLDEQHGPLLNAIVSQLDAYNLLLSQQLAQFGYELACVNWDSPEIVGKQIARSVARLHTPYQIANCPKDAAKEQSEMIENRLASFVKSNFFVPEKLKPHFKEFSSKKILCKDFGRC